MEQERNSLMYHNHVFVWIALATGVILLIPLIAMQFTSEVDWESTDFIVMGTLLFGMSSVYVLAVRKLPSKRRLFVGAIFAAIFLYLWAELAVGIFTNLGT